MFVGRKKELETLEKLYKENAFQMVVIYGRRRIGKTTLISKFADEKPTIFFTALEANDLANLKLFSNKIMDFFKMPSSTPAFSSWIDLFDFIAEKALLEKFILVFDEFPYAAEANKSLKSIIQIAIDHKLKNSNLFLILCGSQMSFMENEVLGYKSPLFGRRTAQLKLAKLNYLEAASFMNGFSNIDKIKLYAAIGGTPHYLAQIKESETYEENILRLYFDISGYLYNEPMMLLQQELREPSLYNSIISAISAGANRLTDISNKIGEERTKVNKYLQTLINLGVLIKEYPFDEDRATSKKGIYFIEDHCYNFWYRFIFSNQSEIETGMGHIIGKSELDSENLSAFVGKPAFEESCMQYLKNKNLENNLPFLATGFGTWWSNDKIAKKQTDIDVVAVNSKQKQIILAECKWKNEFNQVEEINKLLSKASLFENYTEKYFYFFSKCKYKKEAKELAKKHKNLTLVSLDMMYG